MPSPADEIIAAAASGDIERVTALLDTDPALMNATNMFGSTPVHAAHYSGHSGIVRLLFERGRARDGFLAAEIGLIDELRTELDRDPSFVTRFSPIGATALHGACYWGSQPAARLLLERGADVNALTTDSFLKIAPIGSAVAAPDVPNPSHDESVVLALVGLLVDFGADVNRPRRDGMTALHAAAYRGHVEVIRKLLSAGANPNARSHADGGPHAGQSPLDTALSQGQSAAAETLRSAMAR